MAAPARGTRGGTWGPASPGVSSVHSWGQYNLLSSSGRGRLTQDGAQFKLIAEHNPVLVTVSDVVVFEERLINASVSRKDQ